MVLIKAATSFGAKFRVIVADSRPKLEGREMCRHLVSYLAKTFFSLIVLIGVMVLDEVVLISFTCSHVNYFKISNLLI
jgi:translation initiation factor 2B subunit (eIF-2B alpha/beta/delta family)